jgi:hypothetical protein
MRPEDLSKTQFDYLMAYFNDEISKVDTYSKYSFKPFEGGLWLREALQKASS